MDRLAFGTDNGQIYLVPALKLISNLFLNDDHSKDNLGIRTSKTKMKIKLEFI